MSKKIEYFIDPTACPKIDQMDGLETTVLSGYNNEKMMMVLYITP